jgi:hypothetical protein
MTRLCVLVFASLFVFPRAAPAEDEPEEKARIYTTREERREAGEEHRLNAWLAGSDLIEFEAGREWIALTDPSPDTRERDVSSTLSLGLLATPSSWIKAEAIFELEHVFEGDAPEFTLDEGTVSLLQGPFELEAGRLYVPFGEYFSHFATGPLLEFGETRGYGADLSWSPHERLDLSVFGYDGPAEPATGGETQVNWGCALAGSPREGWNIGASYLSDLADAKDGLLEAYGNRYRSRVDGVSAYSVLGAGRFELTAEIVHALKAFAEFPPGRSQPFAWNVELAFFPEGRVDAAVRLEGSQELENAPRLMGGVALSWRPLRAVSLTVEYLHGDYDSAVSDRDMSGRFGMQASLVL